MKHMKSEACCKAIKDTNRQTQTKFVDVLITVETWGPNELPLPSIHKHFVI